MLNTMIIYINKLACEARDVCEQESVFPKGIREFEEKQLKRIVSYFGGKLKKTAFDDSMIGNARIEGTQDEFTIKYKEYNTIDILHELGHAFLHLGQQHKEKTLVGEYGFDEGAASVFARAFLMPEYLFCDDIIKNSKNGVCNIQQVADMYKIRYSDVVARGRELNLW